jgi:hypothetical protein
VISSTVGDVGQSISVVQTRDKELSKLIRILSEISELESLCLIASSFHPTESTPSDKIGNGNTRVMSDRIELLAQHKLICHIVAKLSGDDQAAVIWVDKELDNSIYLLVYLVPF